MASGSDLSIWGALSGACDHDILGRSTESQKDKNSYCLLLIFFARIPIDPLVRNLCTREKSSPRIFRRNPSNSFWKKYITGFRDWIPVACEKILGINPHPDHMSKTSRPADSQRIIRPPGVKWKQELPCQLSQKLPLAINVPEGFRTRLISWKAINGL